MSQDSHLPILIAMFPGKVLLTVDDIAKCLNVSRGHIYNLSSKDRLKLKLYKEEGSDKILVSIIEMARYLDRKLEPDEKEPSTETPVPQLIKKRGRPRGSVSKIQAAFQTQLSLAIVRHEIEKVLSQVYDDIEAVQYEDNGKPCSEKMEDWKSKFSMSVTSAKSSLFRSILELGLSNNKQDKGTITKV